MHSDGFRDQSSSPKKSLQYSLISPFVLLLLLVTTIVALMSYKVASHAVSELSIKLLTEQAERISQAVDQHMHGSGAVLETAFPKDITAAIDLKQDLQSMQERFWTATSLYPDSNDYVYYGNIAGQSFGLKRINQKEMEIRMRASNDVPRKIYFLDKISGQPSYRREEKNIFDPRERPWFKSGRELREHIWTAVYVDYSSQDLVVTRARQVISDQQQFIGVVATDLFLSKLNRFVSQLDISKNARTAIIEPNGNLIAASFTDNIQVNENGEIERVSAFKTQDQLFNRFISDHLTQLSSIPINSHAQVELMDSQDGSKAFIAYKRITDDAGLDWIALIIVPYQDVIGSTQRLTLWVVVAGAIAVLAAIIIGLSRFGSIAKHIRNLAVCVSQFSVGKKVPNESIQREDEIGLLAKSFHSMQQEIFTDQLTGTANRSALLPFLDAQIKLANQAQQPLAVLFLDLNRFKPLNDTWGHKNGDLALIEISQRLDNLIGDNNFLARLGGDEFVIVMPSPTSSADASALKSRIYQEVAKPLRTLENIPDGAEVTLGAAVGVAFYPDAGQDIQAILTQADKAMYEDKQHQGENR